MTKEEKRVQVGRVEAYDAAFTAMARVANDMAVQDAENEVGISREAIPQRRQGYMDEFVKMIGTRPQMPETPKSLNIN